MSKLSLLTVFKTGYDTVLPKMTLFYRFCLKNSVKPCHTQTKTSTKSMTTRKTSKKCQNVPKCVKLETFLFIYGF